MTELDTTATAAPKRLIELGWVILNEPSPGELEALLGGRERLLARLRADFPAFDWQMPVVRRHDPLEPGPAEPVVLLNEALVERDVRGWDFVFIVTRADLVSYHKSYALATPSQALAAGVISLARLIPRPALNGNHDRLARRLCALGLHLLGHLNGLPHRPDPRDLMHLPDNARSLEEMDHWHPDDERDLLGELSQVADIRLEEQPRGRDSHPLPFYLRATWIAAGDIFDTVRRSRFWAFPLHLSRLSTAALSAFLVLLMTAEVWELGMSQSPWTIGILSGLAWLGTSVYILHRQNLLLRRARRRLTEQTVVANVSIILVVFLGMLTSYLLLFALALGLEVGLYPTELVAGWAASVNGGIQWRHYLTLAGFVASLGIGIGALGASFEGQHYFRHIAYVDEEI